MHERVRERRKVAKMVKDKLQLCSSGDTVEDSEWVQTAINKERHRPDGYHELTHIRWLHTHYHTARGSSCTAVHRHCQRCPRNIILIIIFSFFLAKFAPLFVSQSFDLLSQEIRMETTLQTQPGHTILFIFFFT